MKKKKSKKKTYENYLDKLWKLVIDNRDKGCQWCGKVEGKMDLHHIFGRSPNVRWNPFNGIKLCYYCHTWRLKRDYEGFRRVAIEKLGGEDFYLSLYEKSKLEIKAPLNLWEVILENELERLGIEIPKRPKNI